MKRNVHTPGRKPKPIPDNLLAIYKKLDGLLEARDFSHRFFTTVKPKKRGR